MKKVSFIFLLLFFLSSIYGQTIYKSIDTTMISADNTLFFPKGNALPLFFEKLDELIFEGEGNINIMHIGGSHVQAGTFPHTIRTNLLKMYPHIIGNRGMLFPYSAAKTNNPYNYKTSYEGKWITYKNVNKELPYPLGLTGMLIVSEDEDAKISIQIRNNEQPLYDFKQLRLLGYSDSAYIKPVLQTSAACIEGKYDSISKSYLFILDNFIDSFCISFVKKVDTLWEPFYLRGIILENQLPGISYHSIGVNGASVPSYLKCELLENDVALIKPDLCVFAIGINDASGDNFDTSVFKQNYDLLIAKIKKVSPSCEFIFITNNDSYKRYKRRYYNNTNGLLAKEAFYQLAEKYNAGIWDLFTIMGGLTSMKKWEEKNLAQRDKIHFTVKGYQLLGDLFYNALMKEYMNHLQNKSHKYGNQ
ncbi:MAG: hypothetical protein KBA86_02045 [Bacteroidales bacterium]|nr:hypothetical protein [Bacteroidales bacterium]